MRRGRRREGGVMRLRGSGKERGDRRCWGWEKDRAWWDETGNDCEWNVADRWIIAMCELGV